MKFSGTPAQLFRAVQEGTQRFQGVGQVGIPKLALLAAGVAAASTGMALSTKTVEHRQKKEVKKIVRQEVRKAIKPRQPQGISFDLFR